MKINLKKEIILVIFILLIGFLLRLYRFNGPIADWHSWRQADTSSVSRNFVASGFDLLHPKFDDLSNVPSGLDNPLGYRFVEFPIYNVMQAGLFKLIGILTLEEWGRLVTILASLVSSILLYRIIKKRFGFTAGFFSAFFFLFIPFNIYYSRTILPDPSMVTVSLLGIYFFDTWLIQKKNAININFILSLVFTSGALLLKPYALFFTLPMIYLVYEKFGLSFFKKWQLYVYLILSVLPLIGWRIWMTQYPAGIPTSNWLFNGNNIRFRPSFFYWIFYQRITKLILGYFGSVILVLGFLKLKHKKDLLFILSFVASSLLYVTVIATGNVQHDYYQILIIPTIAILLGLGSAYLFENARNKNLGVVVFAILTVIMFSIDWFFIKDYFNINNRSIVEAGIAVDRLTPKNALVLANYNGDTSFLYQTKRKGWASFEKPLPELIQMGAGYLVLANPTPADLNLGKTYKIVDQTKDYIIFNLNKKP